MKKKINRHPLSKKSQRLNRYSFTLEEYNRILADRHRRDQAPPPGKVFEVEFPKEHFDGTNNQKFLGESWIDGP